MKKIIIAIALFFSFANATKLIVLDPGIIEMLYMLDAQDNIIAISKMQTSEIYPAEETRKLISVGSYIKPSLERIVELKPELVITSSHSANINHELNALNIKNIAFETRNLEDLYNNIRTVAKIVNKEVKAEELIKKIKSKLISNSKIAGKKAVVIFSMTNLLTLSDNSLPNDIIKSFGLINITKDLVKGGSSGVQLEYILEKDPDFIIVISSSSKDILTFHPILSKTTAAKNNKIVSIPASIIMRASPRIGDGIEQLYEMLIK